MAPAPLQVELFKHEVAAYEATPFRFNVPVWKRPDVPFNQWIEGWIKNIGPLVVDEPQDDPEVFHVDLYHISYSEADFAIDGVRYNGFASLQYKNGDAYREIREKRTNNGWYNEVGPVERKLMTGEHNPHFAPNPVFGFIDESGATFRNVVDRFVFAVKKSDAISKEDFEATLKNVEGFKSVPGLLRFEYNFPHPDGKGIFDTEHVSKPDAIVFLDFSKDWKDQDAAFLDFSTASNNQASAEEALKAVAGKDATVKLEFSVNTVYQIPKSRAGFDV